MSIALAACAGVKPAPRHAAHGHAIATIEHPDDPSMMLERVEDEDTRWIELPHFGECPYDADDIPPFKAADVGHVPGLDPARTRLTNMDAGDATIHNAALLQHLDQATAEVLTCVSAGSNCIGGSGGDTGTAFSDDGGLTFTLQGHDYRPSRFFGDGQGAMGRARWRSKTRSS